LPTVQATPVSPPRQLLATLPADAGGLHFERYVIVDDSLDVGHLVDDVLAELGKERKDAVAVFRDTDESIIGATVIDGVDGETLLKAFVETWEAGAVIARRQRPVAGTAGWELTKRRSGRVVVYRFANVVYLVSAPDFVTLEAILADMPPGGL
jgi:hypothetical protein